MIKNGTVLIFLLSQKDTIVLAAIYLYLSLFFNLFGLNCPTSAASEPAYSITINRNYKTANDNSG
jgi:hypothetical protein